jgi:hypothetical protein
VQIDQWPRACGPGYAEGAPAEIPEGDYHGEYLRNARAVLAAEGPGSPATGRRVHAARLALRIQREEQDRDLADLVSASTS